MTMFTAVVVLALVAVFEADAERMKCQMVPLQTSGGLMGMCCVFPKNFSADEIRNSLLESGSLLFPEDTKDEDKIPVTRIKDIVFPGAKPTEKKKEPMPNTPSDEMKKGSNSSVIYFPEEAHTNETTGEKATVDKIANRNKNDAPETCVDGEMLDPNGDCVQPF